MTMLSSSRDVVSTLNDLIETCKDSEEGFRHAAQHVMNREIRSPLETYAQQVARFADELQAEVRYLGGNPDEHDVFDGLAHPGWITLTRKLTGEDETAVMAECDCGVDALEQSYAHALEQELPSA